MQRRDYIRIPPFQIQLINNRGKTLSTTLAFNNTIIPVINQYLGWQKAAEQPESGSRDEPDCLRVQVSLSMLAPSKPPNTNKLSTVVVATWVQRAEGPMSSIWGRNQPFTILLLNQYVF